MMNKTNGHGPPEAPQVQAQVEFTEIAPGIMQMKIGCGILVQVVVLATPQMEGLLREGLTKCNESKRAIMAPPPGLIIPKGS